MGKAYISTHEYQCEMEYHDESGNSLEIIPETVSYIIIEHDYSTRIMPYIVLKVKLMYNVYSTMVQAQSKGKVYFRLIRYKTTGATSTAGKDVICDEFDYFMSDDADANQDVEETAGDSSEQFQSTIIGLVKKESQEQNHKTLGGVYTDTNVMGLIEDATSDFEIMIQPFKNNSDISTFSCPTISTIGQFIQYVNNRYSFYNGSYIYYLDFDMAYLRSNDGEYIDIRDNDFKYVAFGIEDISKYPALSDGMVEDMNQNAYIVYISPNDATIITDRTSSELNANIQSVETGTGTVSEAAKVDTSSITNVNNNIDSATLLASTDPNAAANVSTQIAEHAVTISLRKTGLDTRIFKPNKQYMISYYEGNQNYCGIYYLVDKKEIYVRKGAQFKSELDITMRKCADFVEGGKDKTQEAL